jgi:hypothetical protein
MKSEFFRFACKGTDRDGNQVLAEPVAAILTFQQFQPGHFFGTKVKCPHCTGTFGQCCSASNPEKGVFVFCPYIVSMPTPERAEGLHP